MPNHRRNLIHATLALLPLAGCLQPMSTDDTSGTSTGTTAPLEDDTTWGHIQTVTGPDVPTTTVPTTGDTTTAEPTTGDPSKPELDASCEMCGNPEGLQVCFCIDNATSPILEDTLYGCPGDAGFPAAAESACKAALNKTELAPADLHCMQQIMCPMPGMADPLDDICELCEDSSVDQFYCVSDLNVIIFTQYACEDNFVAETSFKAQCSELLDKPESELTASNFFKTLASCPGGDTTTGDDTTGGSTTADDTTGDATTGSTAGDTTGATTGDGTTGDGTTGGLAPLTTCNQWEPSAEIRFSEGVYYVQLALVDDLFADFTPLLECDDVRLAPLPTGSFEVRHADPGDLLYELGLRNGDIPLTLNGHDLADASSVLTAVAQLWFIEAALKYELVVQRDGEPHTRAYILTN